VARRHEDHQPVNFTALDTLELIDDESVMVRELELWVTHRAKAGQVSPRERDCAVHRTRIAHGFHRLHDRRASADCWRIRERAIRVMYNACLRRRFSPGEKAATCSLSDLKIPSRRHFFLSVHSALSI
jgi:hypothetical protein